MTPMQVTEENAPQVFQNLYGKPLTTVHKMEFKNGDLVRISKVRGVFNKKYEQSFTGEVFTVSDCIPRILPVCKLNDYYGKPIQGSFYEQV